MPMPSPLETSELLGTVIPDPSELVRLRLGARELSFFPRLNPRAAMTGGHLSRFRGRGMDFEEVRLYQPGDDVRTIDWRVTARTLAPHTKVFREERERPVLVITDLRTPMFFGSAELKSMTACRVAATLAWAGLNANDRVGGLVFGPNGQRDVRARRSHHSVLQFIHTMSEVGAELLDASGDEFTLAQVLEDIRRVAHPGSTVMLVSDFHDLDTDCERHLFELARHCDINLCMVYDPLESRLPPPGRYQVTDGENRRTLDTGAPHIRKEFESRFAARCTRLQQLSARLRIGTLEFSTDSNVLAVLLKAYGRSRTRRRR